MGPSAPHITATVLWFLSAVLETHPSTRAVQRCFVRSNSISEFLHRTHHISKQTRASALCAAPHAQSQKHAQRARDALWERARARCLHPRRFELPVCQPVKYPHDDTRKLFGPNMHLATKPPRCLSRPVPFVINSLTQLLLKAMSPDPRAGSRLRALISAWTTTTAEASFRKETRDPQCASPLRCV